MSAKSEGPQSESIWVSESIVTQPWVKPHAGSECWRQKPCF